MKHQAIKKSLQSKMKQQAISPLELQEGITECFVLTNRNFLRRRMGRLTPLSKIDAITREMVTQVFRENGISDEYASVADLRKACLILENQMEFEADPVLADNHREIIGTLFNLAQPDGK